MNVAIGRQALNKQTTASHNVAVGAYARRYNNNATNTVAVGLEALRGSSDGSPLSGDGNTACGRSAGEDIQGGGSNTFIGYFAGREVTTGSNNTLLGRDAGRSGSPSGTISSGSDTICLGNNSVNDLFCADTSISSSDARDKTDVEDFKHGLSWITELRPVTYRWDKRCWYEDEDVWKLR